VVDFSGGLLVVTRIQDIGIKYDVPILIRDRIVAVLQCFALPPAGDLRALFIDRSDEAR
jgi:hypothetical protein